MPDSALNDSSKSAMATIETHSLGKVPLTVDPKILRVFKLDIPDHAEGNVPLTAQESSAPVHGFWYDSTRLSNPVQAAHSDGRVPDMPAFELRSNAVSP